MLALACAVLGTVPAIARADAPSCPPGAVDCAAAAFARGTESFDRGDYEEARAWFAAAAAVNDHPTVVFNLALSEARSGKVLAAAERFRALLGRKGLKPSLRGRVQRELEACEARFARISLELLDFTDTRVLLDGVPTQPTANEIVVDPGKHHLRVETRGEVVLDQSVDLLPAERLKLRVSSRTRAIDVVVVPTVERAPRPAEPVAAEPESARSGLAPVWFYVAAGGTALLAGATVWSGLDVQSAYDRYERDLPHLTQAEADRRVEDGHGRERRTNLLLGATALGVAGTAVLGLVLVDWSGQESGSARVAVGPGGVMASARF